MAAIGAVILASAIWGWWGFGIATAIAVVVVIVVFSNRRQPAPAGQGANQPGQPAARGGRQPDRVVQIFENIGGLVSLVLFGGLVFAAIGLAQECGSGVSAELARLHKTVEAQASTRLPAPTAPQPTPPVQPLGTSANGDPIYPAGTVLHFTATAECGEWKLRIMNAEWAEKEKVGGKELVQWFPVKEKDFYWTMSRDGWPETKGDVGCKITGQTFR
ncbi:hypothetical protein HY932_01220 [Candidatus Falkowbacteria bacterium]|nr:hypothetical protein [Candidatus Falkowbacteria bacterium]